MLKACTELHAKKLEGGAANSEISPSLNIILVHSNIIICPPDVLLQVIQSLRVKCNKPQCEAIINLGSSRQHYEVSHAPSTASPHTRLRFPLPRRLESHPSNTSSGVSLRQVLWTKLPMTCKWGLPHTWWKGWFTHPVSVPMAAAFNCLLEARSVPCTLAYCCNQMQSGW